MRAQQIGGLQEPQPLQPSHTPAVRPSPHSSKNPPDQGFKILTGRLFVVQLAMMAPPTLQPTQTLPPMTAPMASMMLNYQQPPTMPATSAATYQPVRSP